MIQKNWVNNELVNRFGNDMKLHDMIRSFEREYEQEGHVICSVEINGIRISNEYEETLSQTCISEVETLDIFLSEPLHLVKSVLVDWTQILPNLIKEGDMLAALISSQGIEGQHKKFSDFIDAGQLLISSLEKIRPFLQDLKSINMDFAIWATHQADFAKVVREVLLAFKDGNFDSVAELIEYDLNHNLQTWYDYLSEITDRLSKSE